MSAEERIDAVQHLQSLGYTESEAWCEISREETYQNHVKEFDGYYDSGRPIGFM